VKQLLTFARMGSPENREILTIGRLISEVDNMMRPSLKTEGIKLDSYSEEIELAREGNRVQIQQVFMRCAEPFPDDPER
jgi:signal transduction histidine kinase